MIARILPDPQGGEGNGTNPAPPTAPATSQGDAAAVSKAFDNLLEKHKSDGIALARTLFEEAKGHRDTIRELKAKLPPEGGRTLTADEAKAWDAYRSIGGPEDIRKGLSDRDSFRAESEGLRKARTLAEAATLHGYRPGVLETLAKDLDVAIVEGKDKDGKAVRVARVKGEGDESTPLVEYAEARWADFLPSLKAEAPPPKGGSPRPAASAPVPRVAPTGPDAVDFRLRQLGAGSF